MNKLLKEYYHTPSCELISKENEIRGMLTDFPEDKEFINSLLTEIGIAKSEISSEEDYYDNCEHEVISFTSQLKFFYVNPSKEMSYEGILKYLSDSVQDVEKEDDSPFEWRNMKEYQHDKALIEKWINDYINNYI